MICNFYVNRIFMGLGSKLKMRSIVKTQIRNRTDLRNLNLKRERAPNDTTFRLICKSEL